MVVRKSCHILDIEFFYFHLAFHQTIYIDNTCTHTEPDSFQNDFVMSIAQRKNEIYMKISRSDQRISYL